jgi:hypothetical protein
MDLAKDKTSYKFLWVQTFVKMTKKEQNTNHFKNIYSHPILPINHHSH